MRLDNERRSDNVEDRRGRLPGGPIALGGGGLVVVLLIAMLFGVDPRQLLEATQGAQDPTGTTTTQAIDPAQEPLKDFVSVVLAETEDVWREQFRAMDREYRDPTLVLFTERVESACGLAGSATGPFYCPSDEKLYIDLSFFELLHERLGAPGDFAQAYVVAHEVGHHVQKQLGITDRVHQMRGQLSEAEYNQLSVRLELQADFFAGVWAHHAQRTRQILEPGDIDEALRAASAIGDDRLQKQSQGYVVPDAFTHGTSEQRVRWFKRGYESGDPRQGDTFSATSL